MATFVLIHGGNMSTDTWNRLTRRNGYPAGGQLGPRYWDGTVSFLEAYGHHAFAPTLADEHDHNLTDHIEQVSALISGKDLREVILVGHSYGGMVITGIAAGMPDRIRRLVYVDAALPDPGQSLFDLFSEGKVNPFSFPGLEAASAYVEKLQFDARKIRPLPKTYILCTESEFAVVTHVAKRKIVAHGEGWTYLELPTSHVPMATMPERFNQLLLEAVNGRE
jgi:pimeloyl-ACP methyl ester carboxylesterase